MVKADQASVPAAHKISALHFSPPPSSKSDSEAKRLPPATSFLLKGPWPKGIVTFY